MNFTRIGYGFKKLSLKGYSYIQLSLDPSAINRLELRDYKKIFLFPNDHKTNKDSFDFTVHAPVSDERVRSTET